MAKKQYKLILTAEEVLSLQNGEVPISLAVKAAKVELPKPKKVTRKDLAKSLAEFVKDEDVATSRQEFLSSVNNRIAHELNEGAVTGLRAVE